MVVVNCAYSEFAIEIIWIWRNGTDFAPLGLFLTTQIWVINNNANLENWLPCNNNSSCCSWRAAVHGFALSVAVCHRNDVFTFLEYWFGCCKFAFLHFFVLCWTQLFQKLNMRICWLLVTAIGYIHFEICFPEIFQIFCLKAVRCAYSLTLFDIVVLKISLFVRSEQLENITISTPSGAQMWWKMCPIFEMVNLQQQCHRLFHFKHPIYNFCEPPDSVFMITIFCRK